MPLSTVLSLRLGASCSVESLAILIFVIRFSTFTYAAFPPIVYQAVYQAVVPLCENKIFMSG